ncbi:MAG: hypothetical protein IJ058_04565 [Lachnospiraceae bacterium]|nr:hypothetical protein [Lachnospiraceae bacterium]
MGYTKLCFFALGTLFGAEGIRVLSGKDAKKLYTHCTAAVLRAKDCVLDQVTVLRENCTDIYEDAKAINEERAAKEEEINDRITDEAPARDTESTKEDKAQDDGKTAE